MGSKVKIKQLTSENELFGKVLISNGDSGLAFYDASGLSFISKGTSFPDNPTGGTLCYRTDVGLLFIYDYSRNKWLTVSEDSLECGRTSAIAGSTIYMRVGDATQSSTTGFKMIRNGTIVGASVQNNNTLTTIRNVEIRVNNSTVDKVTLTILTGTTGAIDNNFNLDFSQNDLIQVVAVPSTTGAALDNVIVKINLAYRI